MYKRHLLQIAVLVFTIIIMGFSAWAVPGTINYQGRLTDPNGVSMDGYYIMEFYLYNAESGGSHLWTEQQNVAVTNRIYSVELGKITSFPPDFFDNETLYLEVKVFSTSTGWETLSPRQRLTSTPFAMKAGNADTLDGYDSTDLAPTNHTHNSEDITSGIIDETYIDQAITRDSELTIHAADPSVHHTKTTSFTDLIDTATDDQIPDDITINYAMDADKVDGKHASEFGDRHSLDAADGTPVDAVYVDTNGNVGIGTTSPGSRLEVAGTVHSTSGGFKFPDGLVQNEASWATSMNRKEFSLEPGESHWENIQDQRSGLLVITGWISWPCTMSSAQLWLVTPSRTSGNYGTCLKLGETVSHPGRDVFFSTEICVPWANGIGITNNGCGTASFRMFWIR